jgi:hypothetical protein
MPHLRQLGRVLCCLSDPDAGFATRSFTVIVRGTNLPQAIISTPPTIPAVNMNYTYSGRSHDCKGYNSFSQSQRTRGQSFTVRFTFALRTAASIISWPMRLMATDTGPSSGCPCSRQWRKYCTGF